MLKTLQYAKGYVRIKVTGFSLERFLNMAAFRGIYIWNAVRTPEGVEFNVSIKGFKLLKGCARKTSCRTRIIEKNGIPFVLHRYRYRKVLMGGVLFFILGLFALSTFVWRIEIEGNESLHHETIMVFLEAQGLRIGASKFTLSDNAIQQSLLSSFDELSWADVHTRGTRTTIRLTEILPPQPIVNRQTPAHVVASKDGLITHVITWSGAPLVRQGDVVREGEMLISGILELESDTPGTPLVYTHAYAEVWARRYHSIEFLVPFTYSERVFTGQTSVERSFQLLFLKNRRITLPGGGNSFTSYDRITTHIQPGVSGTFPLPIVITTTHYAEFIPTPRTRNLEEAKDLAESMITSRIIREFDFGIDIVDRQIIFTETPSALKVSGLITTHERIDRHVPITVE